MDTFLRKSSNRKDIAVLVHEESSCEHVLDLAYVLAEHRNEMAHVLIMGESLKPPTWFAIPSALDEARFSVVTVPRSDRGKLIAELKRISPVLLIVGAAKTTSRTGGIVSDTIDPIIQRSRCPVAIVRASRSWAGTAEAHGAFVPLWDDASSRFALRAALAIDPGASVTVGIPADLLPGDEGSESFKERVDELTDGRRNDPRVRVLVVEGDGAEDKLVEESEKHAVTLLGMRRGNVLLRTLFGDPSLKLAERIDAPTITVREYQGIAGDALFRFWSVWSRLLPTLNVAQRAEVYREVRRSARPTRDFFTMIALSAGIASIGLVLNSAAVIIGAMLVAPLMASIVGMGMAVIHGDPRFLMTCGRAASRGVLIAIVTGMLVGWVTAADEATTEMLARTEPSYLDLAVALVSGVAAAYALSRKDVSSSLPGVAIAVALVPPLATTGVSLAIAEWALAWGSLLLFLTNLTAITFASALVFAALGFRPTETKIADRKQARSAERSAFASVILVLIVAVLLAFEMATELRDERQHDALRAAIVEYLDSINVPTFQLNWRVKDTLDDERPEFRLTINAARSLSATESAGLQTLVSTELGRPAKLYLSVVPTTVVP